MKLKGTLLLLFYLLAAVIIGALLANACRDIPFLSWLAFGGSIGISPAAPFVLDLWILRFSIGFVLDITVAQVITSAIAIFAYHKTRI